MMQRRWIEIVAALLGVIWLGSLGVALFFVAGLVDVPWLLGALVAQIGVFAVATALLLTTNTRRPAGIDPNAPERRIDPFALPTEQLKIGVDLGDGQPYGRRNADDPAVVKRMIRQFEEEDRQRPPPANVPAWARDLQQAHDEAGDEQ